MATHLIDIGIVLITVEELQLVLLIDLILRTYRMPAQCDRERYGYHPVFDAWDEEPEIMVDDKKAKSDHKLRSRLQISYDIKKCPFEP